MAAIGYLTNGAVIDGLIEIENLVLVVLYDELHDAEPAMPTDAAVAI